MILEYERYCHPDRLASRCEEILDYISSDVFDTYSYVKIYPKVIYYLYISTSDKDRDWARLLRLSSTGIEQLRTTGRTYYFWELLEIREEGLTKLLNTMGEDADSRKRQALQNVIDTAKAWMGAFDFVHNMCGTHRKMETSCYLYQQKEAYCIGDVIRRRREMLGLTKKELCKGICSEKTIGRLEAKKTKPQIDIVRQLFERLNLSGEYQRWQIVTKDIKAFSIVGKIIQCANNRDFKNTQEYLNELGQYASMENPINRQYKERIEVNLKLRQGLISKEGARIQLEKILAYTIPPQTAIKEGEKYLTNVEIQCLLDIAINMGKSQMNQFYDALVELCNQLENDDGITEHIAVWEIIMTNVANTFGDMGRYDESDSICMKIMEESMYCYRLNILAANVYNNIWNYTERIRKSMPIKQEFNEKNVLKKCIVLCQISRNTTRESIVRKRLEKL